MPGAEREYRYYWIVYGWGGGGAGVRGGGREQGAVKTLGHYMRHAMQYLVAVPLATLYGK